MKPEKKPRPAENLESFYRRSKRVCRMTFFLNTLLPTSGEWR